MKATRLKMMRRVAALAMGAGLFQLAGCSPEGLVSFFTNQFNPCINILACDPGSWRFLTSGYQGPGVDPELDPACVFPPFCAGDPFVGGLAPQQGP